MTPWQKMWIQKRKSRRKWPGMAGRDEAVHWRECRRKSKWKRRMTNDQHGKIQPWTSCKIIQEIKEEQDQRVVRKLIFFVIRVFREEARPFLWAMLWLGFPSARTTAKQATVTSVSTQDIFSGTLRCWVARINLLSGGASPARSFLPRNQCNCQIVF